MNYTKIQQDLIKDALSGKGANWCIQMTDTDAIVGTRYQLYVIDLKYFLLKVNELIGHSVKSITSAKSMVDGAKDAKILTKTGIKRQCGEHLCMELKVDDTLIYLDEKLLKYYDKKAEFYGTTSTAPVYVYESDILVGVVLPVKVR